MIVVNTGSDIYQVFHRNKSINWVRNNLTCLLYTSDAADERSSVDLGGRRIIKKKYYGEVQRTRLCDTKIHIVSS